MLGTLRSNEKPNMGAMSAQRRYMAAQSNGIFWQVFARREILFGSQNLHSTTPRHGMCGLQIEVGPIVRDPSGGVMDGTMQSRR